MVNLENDKKVIKQLLGLLNEQKEQVKGYEVGEIAIANELLMANRLKSYLDEIESYKKALERACEHIEAFSDSCYYCPRKQYCDEKCELDSGSNECIDWIMNYFKKEALKGE